MGGEGGGSLEPRTAIEGSFSVWGGLGKLDRGLVLGETFFLTAIAIAIATRPFKFHENSVSYTSSSFVSSIHSLALLFIRCCYITVDPETSAP